MGDRHFSVTIRGEDRIRKWGHSWHHFLIQNVVEILPGMVRA
jgi:hypothetical protein